jgi:hypothetical protein
MSAQLTALVLPAFGKSPELSLEMSKIREAEARLIEAKTVNPITYADLEHTFNEAYRDLKRHLAAIGFQLDMANKHLEEVKADIILDKYPQYLEDKAIKKSNDSADLRKAFMARDPAYQNAIDRIAQLTAVQSNMDGKIKVMENVCRYMRKQMDLVLRSGLSGKDLYNTNNWDKK